MPRPNRRRFDLTWSTFDGGGATFTASGPGGFELSGTIGQPNAGVMAGGGFELTGGFWAVGAGTAPACASAADCADTDGNGIRDDNCVWVECSSDTCNTIEINFADLGGPFGACEPDGFANLFDRSHALTCFAGSNPCSSYNIDAGGAFGACGPDGFCNLFDANHVLTSFAGSNECTCPAGPAPQPTPQPVGATALSLEADPQRIRPGGTTTVRVFADDPLDDLQSYQLHMDTGGGRQGALTLVEIRVEDRRDGALAPGDGMFEAFNRTTGQMLAGLDRGGVATSDRAYLATFVYRVSDDAEGSFVVDVRHDESAGDQTYLVSDFTAPVAVTGVAPAVIFVESSTQGPLEMPAAKADKLGDRRSNGS